MAIIPSNGFTGLGPSILGSATLPIPPADSNVNPPDIATIFNTFFYNRNVVAPVGVQQIAAFAFDYIGDQMVDLEVEAPDHWLEDNTAVQDHVAVRPVVVTLKGFVSELHLGGTLIALINSVLNSSTSALSQVNLYLGSYTPGTVQAMQQAISQAQNVITKMEQAIARAAQLGGFFPGQPQMNRQQQAYNQLASYAQARVVFTIYTPFQVFNNMVITSLRAIQPRDTKGWTDFTVTMKQLNFVNNISQSQYTAQGAGRNANQVQQQVQNGGTSGVAATLSTLNKLFVH